MVSFVNFLCSYLPTICLYFLDNNLGKYECIFTKLGMCIDILEIWFGIANEQISSILTEVSARHMSIFISG